MYKTLKSEDELHGKSFIFITTISGNSKEDIDNYAKEELSRLKKNQKSIRSELVKEALKSGEWEPRLLYLYIDNATIYYNLYIVRLKSKKKKV